MASSSQSLRVIIIGAAVSGLTLAHMLERAGIDFVILERGREVAFAGGASIGLQPNALRILDQLGLYEEICATTVPIKTAYHRRSDGSVIGGSKFAGELHRRHGYPILFLEREELLHILYRTLKGLSKVICSQKVVDIHYDLDRAVAVTATGETFEGDIIVGADGVRSFTREAIWKNLRTTEPDVAQKESTGMTCQYACVFGVSVYESDDPELLPGTSHITYDDKRSGICIVTSRNKKFWFLFLRLKRKFTFPDIPRFTEQEMEDTLDQNANLQVTNRTRLGDLSSMRSKLTMVALEEAVFTRWFDGRFAILGDAAHKVTPNAGHGGNTAIESAVTLANLLYDATNSRGGASSLSYDEALAVFEQYQNTRNERVAKACAMSAMGTRLQAMDNFIWKFLGLNIMPLFGEETEVSASSELLLGGESLKFVAYKGRAGTIPWEGWTPQSLTDQTIILSSQWFGANILSILPFAFASATVAVHYLAYPVSISLNAFVAAGIPADDTRPHRNLEILITFLDLLPFATIGAIELLRMKNRLLQPFILPLLYAAVCSSRNVSCLWLNLLSFAYVKRPYQLDQAYANTLTVSNARIIARTVIGSVALVGSFCSPWPKSRSSGFAMDTVAAISLACPLAVPLMTSSFNSLIGYESSDFMYGHEDLPPLKFALVISFAFSSISNLAHLTAVGLGELPLWTNHTLIMTATLLLVFLGCLSSAPSRHSSTGFKVKFGLLAGFLGVFCGPGSAAALLWLWREDKVRCRG
ncbi:hypothetical protein BJX99DRAFT_271659 [Aspergillus californicus]